MRRAQARALKLLAVRDRTEKELRDRLQAAGFDEAVTEETVAWCRRLGYVDDARFARGWVEHRLRLSPCGRVRLEGELKEKGVAAEIIAATLAEMLTPETEERLCLEEARRQARRLAEAGEEGRRRLAAYLARRGFTWEQIRTALAHVDSPSDKDYNTPECT